MTKLQRRRAAKRAAQTRKFYVFEDYGLTVPESLLVDQSMNSLRALARRVWREFADPRQRIPQIVSGRGDVSSGGVRLSYAIGGWKFHRIVLARHQRTRYVLMHELTHALGPIEHGRAFARLFGRLLERFGRVDSGLYTLQGQFAGIKV